MLVKVFASKGPLNGVHGKVIARGNRTFSIDWIPTLEEEINRWLYQNPAITISEIHQSSAFGWFGRPHCVVTIWYEPPKFILTREAAQKLVLESLANPHDREGIVITQVIERPFGWVFCYDSKRYIETGESQSGMVGNNPILVDRHQCTLHPLRGLEGIEVAIDRYEKTGQTNA